MLETCIGYYVFFQQFREFGFGEVELRGSGIAYRDANNILCDSKCCPAWCVESLSRCRRVEIDSCGLQVLGQPFEALQRHAAGHHVQP